MKIKMSELKALADCLLTHVEAQGGTEIEVSDDYYWQVSKAQRYDPYTTPSDLTLGQLTDDWDELQKILKGEREPLG